ncbi:hypothetical protein CE91St41_24170 [Oscillospiraceae bacterium]|nr:hypothetical protein CE91St40_13370 [Oscillospiraceae bacterium]BDF75528.1 hypothetical protein CE91St41_24170 [Oscillospiraceae bacterium]
MEKFNSEIYSLVDEKYMADFSRNHKKFMEEYYYQFYSKFCTLYRRKPLPKNEFYLNMHRRRIQLYQLYCPYCGAVDILIIDKKIHKTATPNFCPYCGKRDTTDNILRQISRFIRIQGINWIGIKGLINEKPSSEEWLLAYDCYQMEIIELASIIEVFLRDYFETLLLANNFNANKDCSEYVKKAVRKNTRNDFMNIEKANRIYKQAFRIDLKGVLSESIWNDLIDIVNLRNMMIHNNGRIDNAFKQTPTYLRLKGYIIDDLFKLEKKDIEHYFNSVYKTVLDITEIFLMHYLPLRNENVANYYFNNESLKT